MKMQLAPVLSLAYVAAASAQTVLGPELLLNPGAENGTTGWIELSSDASAPTGDAQSGERAFLVADRVADWSGIGQQLPPGLEGGTYEVAAWIKVSGAGTHRAKLTFKTVDASGTGYRQAIGTWVPGNEWVELRGWYNHAPQGTVSELLFFAEGPAGGVDFRIDDLSIRRIGGSGGDWRVEADERIEELRKGDARVIVVDQHWDPLEGASVAVEQTRQAFPFGSAIAAGGLGNPQYEAFFREHFNWAVTENEMKWYHTHPWQFANNYAPGDAILAFCEENGIPLRAHNLFWAVQQYVPQWVQNLSDQALSEAIDDRIDDMVGRYAGRVPHWDVNNEMLHGRYFADRLGDDIRVHMFQRAKQVDPGAELFVNDYNIITSGETFAYVQQIRDLLEAGAPIDGIGVQGHFASNVDPVTVLAKLDTLSQFGLPIWVTEFDVNAPDKNVVADELEEFYRAAFSHPNVGGILMWGFWEDRHWRPNAAIVDSDWTVNVAGERYIALMDEWTTETSGETDASGAFAFRGFHGDYSVTVTAADAEPVVRTLVVDVDPETDEVVVTVQVEEPCLGDRDGSGFVTINDLLHFLNSFRESDPSADVDGQPGVNVGDLLAFLAAFRAGC